MKKAYQLYHPAGNDTALVEGLISNSQKRQELNQLLLDKHPQVEQVGFLSTTGTPQLLMAGGEFCGNASRCAALYYLNENEGTLSLKVCDGSRQIQIGIKQGEAWAEIPLLASPEKSVRQLASDTFEVKLEGITHLVHFSGKPVHPKARAMELLHMYQTDDPLSMGVIFVEEKKIYPVVLVKKIHTLFYETACGSGTVAVALVAYARHQKAQRLSLQQPSGEWITAEVNSKNARISGKVIKQATDSIEYSD